MDSLTVTISYNQIAGQGVERLAASATAYLPRINQCRAQRDFCIPALSPPIYTEYEKRFVSGHAFTGCGKT